MHRIITSGIWLLMPLLLQAQLVSPRYLLKPLQVFDGRSLQRDWVVLTEGERIIACGPLQDIQVPEDVTYVELSGLTLMPGLIEGHGHLFLYPYDRMPWNDQVLKESQALRVARATVHARETLMAGVTTFRDLGTEGAGYADVGLKQAIDLGVIPGPRLLIATRAIVATGSYGPKGFAADHSLPIGAEVADGHDQLMRTVREQIGKGADIIKVYADYRWGARGEAQPTFTQAELDLIVEVANSSGRPVVAHAATAEGMLRAVNAGAQTIEHGDGANEQVLRLMAAKGIALCPTLSAAEAILQYQGWVKGSLPEPERLRTKREVFQMALKLGVPLCAGSDIGVFAHGDNFRELQLMAEYGMSSSQAVIAATSGNAQILGLSEQVGIVAPGLWADLIAVQGNPLEDIKVLSQVAFVMKSGKIYKLP